MRRRRCEKKRLHHNGDCGVAHIRSMRIGDHSPALRAWPSSRPGRGARVLLDLRVLETPEAHEKPMGAGRPGPREHARGTGARPGPCQQTLKEFLHERICCAKGRRQLRSLADAGSPGINAIARQAGAHHYFAGTIPASPSGSGDREAIPHNRLGLNDGGQRASRQTGRRTGSEVDHGENRQWRAFS